MNYFEHFKLGDQWELGSWQVSAEEAINFAKEYDPQPIHTDPEMAAKSPFGAIIVSGWFTTLKTGRRFIDHIMKDTAGLASPGMEGVNWLRPVMLNEEISGFARVLDVKASKSKPDRGKVWFEMYAENKKGQKVMSTKGLFFIAKQPT